MKKLIGIFLSIAMLLGLSATALASTPPDTPPISPTGIVYPQETVSSATGFFRGTDLFLHQQRWRQPSLLVPEHRNHHLHSKPL